MDEEESAPGVDSEMQAMSVRNPAIIYPPVTCIYFADFKMKFMTILLYLVI